MKIIRAILVIACISALFVYLGPALCWSNGGYSADPTHPDYGTHDWIAHHALDYLPVQEKQYITDNLQLYLFGTELPDLPANQGGGIGDTTKHHIYYSAAGALVEDASAKRAQTLFNTALNNLENGNLTGAAEAAGAITHYIADVAVFGHVMGASTVWGTETHHSDYESHVNHETSSYQSIFNMYLTYDDNLTTLTAYDAAANLAYDTTFGGSSQLSCVWMDQNYNWNNQTFSNRCGESLNLAVNAVADVLHTLYVEASSDSPTATPTPTISPFPKASSPTSTVSEFPSTQTLAAAMLTVLAIAVICKKKLH